MTLQTSVLNDYKLNIEQLEFKTHARAHEKFGGRLISQGLVFSRAPQRFAKSTLEIVRFPSFNKTQWNL